MIGYEIGHNALAVENVTGDVLSPGLLLIQTSSHQAWSLMGRLTRGNMSQREGFVRDEEGVLELMENDRTTLLLNIYISLELKTY